MLIQKYINERHKYKIDETYQRPAGAWSNLDNQCLIDTILRGEPMPLFFINNKSDEGLYYIVDGQQRFEAEAEARRPEIIIFAIGINDTQYLVKEDKVRVGIEEFKNNITELISKAKNFTNKIIFINSTPVDEAKTNPIPWHTNRSYNNERIERNNKIIKEVCNKKNLQYIDIYNKFLERSHYKDLLFDGLHPNEVGHKLMFEIIKNKLGL